MRLVFVAAILALVLTPGAAPLPAGTQPACADAPTPTLFASWATQLENLAFDGAGALYVSDLGGDHLLRATPDGAIAIVEAVPGMHGLAVGPEGLLYVGATAGGAPGVWRYTSLDPPVREIVATGLVAANGMAFDSTGALFVSNPGLGTGAPYLVRIPPGGGAWTAWGSTYGANGLAAIDGALVAAVTADQSSPIVAISTEDPQDTTVIAELSFGAATLQPGAHMPSGDTRGLAPKGLDDLAIGPDGMIYVAAHVTGEVLRLDPGTGDACVLASGLQEPTSVRFAVGFGTWDGQLFVTDMGGEAVTALFGPGAGAIWAIPIAH